MGFTKGKKKRLQFLRNCNLHVYRIKSVCQHLMLTEENVLGYKLHDSSWALLIHTKYHENAWQRCWKQEISPSHRASNTLLLTYTQTSNIKLSFSYYLQNHAKRSGKTKLTYHHHLFMIKPPTFYFSWNRLLSHTIC